MTKKTKTAPAKPLNQLEDLLDLYLVQKAPSLPENFKEVIVNFAPWLILVTVVLASPAIVAVLGLGAFFAPFGFFAGARYTSSFSLHLILLAVSLVMQIIAIPGLFKKTAKAWRLVYYSTLISALSSLSHGHIINMIVSTAISLYLLFQVKKYYSK